MHQSNSNISEPFRFTLPVAPKRAKIISRPNPTRHGLRNIGRRNSSCSNSGVYPDFFVCVLDLFVYVSNVLYHVKQREVYLVRCERPKKMRR